MATLASLVIKLSADSAKFQAGMKKADRDAQKFGKRIDRLGSNMTKMFKGIGALIGVTFVASGIRKVTEAFIRQEQAIFQLEQRLKSTGGAAGKSSEELQKFASQLQKTTVFGDEATIEMQSLLLTFTKIQGGVFDRATVAVQNVATAMGTDLKSAAIQVGKALNDPKGQLTALSRSGIQFTEDQKDTIKTMVKLGDVAGAQAVILGELENQFGGAAEAASKGLGGSLKQLNNTFGDTLEIIGGGGAGLTGLIRESNEGLTAFNELISGIEGSLVNDTLNGMADGFRFIRESIDAIPELPEWMTEAGSKAFRQALPFPFNVAAGFAEVKAAMERSNLPSSVTFAAPERPGVAKVGGEETAANQQLLAQKLSDQQNHEQLMFDLKMSKMEEENTIREMRETARVEELQRIKDSQVVHDEAMWQLKLEANDREAEQREANEQAILDGLRRQAQAEQQIEQFKMNQKKQFANNAIALLTMLGGKNKAAAIASIALQKGLAIGQTITSTLAAQMMAMAQLGPIAGPPVAASIGAWGAANVGIIAATGLLQASSVGGGGSGGSLGAGGGGQGSAPGFAPQASPDIALEQASISRAITINFHGFVGDLDQLAREVIPSITKAIGDGKQVEVFA